ncbi:MAG: imidazole glycerol phosphate synthase subunit HisH [Candidatus Margulisiibacteriota bacterium]
MTETQNVKVAIVDFGLGNLFSVKRACEQVGLTAFITGDKTELLNADAAVLPGVGAFGDAMANLEQLDMISPIKDFIDSGKPLMGICLGMQLLMSESEEFGSNKGLDIIKGSVVKFPGRGEDGRMIKVPQVGWNQIHKPEHSSEKIWSGSPLKGFNDGEFMYFVHSFYTVPDSYDVVLTQTSYTGIDYCSGLQYKNVFACQFHPEKSAVKGIQIYSNWATMIQK